jgi:NAD+--asparagine ADP-ribosyltransferase
MDGKVFKLGEKEVGVNYPPLHPHCRSTVVPYFDDEIDVSERIAKDNVKGVYYVPSNITYQEWLDRYVN